MRNYTVIRRNLGLLLLCALLLLTAAGAVVLQGRKPAAAPTFSAEEGFYAKPFLLELKDISDMRELLNSVDELNNEYGRNVQTFTYNKVMEGLIEHGMTVDTEEILEDDSIVLTLNV